MGIFGGVGLSDKECKEYKNKISSELKKLYDEKVKNCSKVEELIKILNPDNFEDKNIKKKIKEYYELDEYYKLKRKEYETKFILKDILLYFGYKSNDQKNTIKKIITQKERQDKKNYQITHQHEEINLKNIITENNHLEFQRAINQKEREKELSITKRELKYIMISEKEKEEKEEKERKELMESLQKTIREKKDLELQINMNQEKKNENYEKLKNDLSNRENELSKLKGQLKEIEEKNKEQENKIKKIIEDKKNQEEKIKKISEDSQTKIENGIKIIEERHKKELEDLDKNYNNKLDKLKKEEIQKKKERIRKISNINRTFNKKIEEMKESKVKQILEQHKKSENDFCLGDISKCWEKNVSFLMKNLFDSEKIISTIIYHLKLFINEYKTKLLNIEHLNIILVGPCGVGKSTLINAILKVNAKENFGKPETKDSCYYESEEIPFLRLADSRGIEKDKNFGVEQTFESIQRFIKSQIETNDPDKFIHCIWYCWSGTRLEENEMNLFKKLSETYSLETIPIIIVYTRAIDLDEVEKAKNYILNENKLNNDFIDVVSKDTNVGEYIVPSRNLDILKEISIKRAKEAIKSSCYEGILNEVKKKIKETLEKLMNELKNKSNSEANKIISRMTINSEMETLHKETKNIITTLFFQYFFLSTNVKINQRFNRGN